MSMSDLATQHARLSMEQLRAYEDQGFLVLRSVFSIQEIRRLADAVDAVLRERSASLRAGNLRVRTSLHCETGEPMIEVLDPISDICPTAQAIANDPRLTSILQCLYGDAPCLFKDKYFLKPSGTRGLDLHQDWIGWPGFPTSFLTVLVAIDPFDRNSGGTMVYPRMHRRGYLSPKDGSHHCLKHEQMETDPVCLELETGDIAIFGCFTPHYSEANRSDRSRRGYFISYNSPSDGGDRFESHYAEFHSWIRNRSPEPRRSELFFE
jgi:ectoine hydroxylase-related dioxygenase (phytanoyl-CoA dioxygenase family)